MGSKVATCLWIYTREAWAKRQRLVPEQGVLEETNVVHFVLHEYVCAGVFVDHEWVSERTIIQHEEEILGLELDYKINVACVVQCRILWFSALAELNNIFGREQKVKKYHKVVNKAITYAISRPFGGRHTPRLCMLTPVARVLHNTQEMESRGGAVIHEAVAAFYSGNVQVVSVSLLLSTDNE